MKQPTGNNMPRFRLKIEWLLLVTQTSNGFRAARMEAATLRRVDQAGRLAGWNFLEFLGVARIRVGCGSQQGKRIWMQWI